MGFSEYFRKGIEIIKLDRTTIDEVSKDKNAFSMAMLFFAIGSVISVIIGGPAAWIFAAIFGVFISFIGVGISHLLALLFGGKASFSDFYKPLGIGSLLTWIPIFGALVSFWNLVVEVVVLETVHKLSRGKAIVIVLIPVVIGIVIAIIFSILIASIIGSIIAGGMVGGGFDPPWL